MRIDLTCPAEVLQAEVPTGDQPYVILALFNLADEEAELELSLREVPGIREEATYTVRDLWQGRDLFPLSGGAQLSRTVQAHDAAVIRLSM
mgnify:CR=1 FL=1